MPSLLRLTLHISTLALVGCFDPQNSVADVVSSGSTETGNESISTTTTTTTASSETNGRPSETVGSSENGDADGGNEPQGDSDDYEAACGNGIIDVDEVCDPRVREFFECSRLDERYVAGRARCTLECFWSESECATFVCDSDDDCDNGLWCDGTETCNVDGTCDLGTPVECTGSDESCEYVCEEQAESASCVVRAADSDEDGYGSSACSEAPGDDCDDQDPNSFPGAPETCDGIDSNCNGVEDLVDTAQDFPGEEFVIDQRFVAASLLDDGSEVGLVANGNGIDEPAGFFTLNRDGEASERIPAEIEVFSDAALAVRDSGYGFVAVGDGLGASFWPFDDGGMIGAEQVLTSNEQATSPHLVRTGDGWTAAWVRPEGIYIRRINAIGENVDPIIPASVANGFPDLTSTEDTVAMTFWSEGEGSFLRVFGHDLLTVVPETSIAPAPARRVRIDAHPEGYAVVYSSLADGGPNSHIYFELRDREGQRICGPSQVTPEPIDLFDGEPTFDLFDVASYPGGSLVLFAPRRRQMVIARVHRCEVQSPQHIIGTSLLGTKTEVHLIHESGQYFAHWSSSTSLATGGRFFSESLCD